MMRKEVREKVKEKNEVREVGVKEGEEGMKNSGGEGRGREEREIMTEDGRDIARLGRDREGMKAGQDTRRNEG